LTVSSWVLIPESVIYFYHEDHEGLEDITVLTSHASNHPACKDVGKGREQERKPYSTNH